MTQANREEAAERGEPADAIAGKCVLVVEDDYVLAREVCNDLKRHGAHVLGPAPTVHYANLIIGKRHLDGAILDIKLFGEDVYALVDVLQARGVPIIFATAYQREAIDARFRSFDLMHKPLDLARLREKVAAFSSTIEQDAEETLSEQAPYVPAPEVEIESGGDEVWARLLLKAMTYADH